MSGRRVTASRSRTRVRIAPRFRTLAGALVRAARIRAAISGPRRFAAVPSRRPAIRRACRAASGREEMLILRHVPSRGRSRWASAGREAFAARSHGQSPGGETRVLQLRMTHRASIHVTGAELVAGDGGRAAEVRIMHRQFTFENRVPPCSGAKPPRLYAPKPATPNRPPYPPHQGWKWSHGPSGSQPIEPPKPKPNPNPKPPPNPKKET